MCIQTSLSESYNYRHFRTATNVSAITYISTKTPARTRENSTTTHFSAPNHTPPPSPPQDIQKSPPPQLVATKGVVSIYRIGASPPAQLTTVNRSQHRRRTRILNRYYSAASALGLGSSFTRLRICSTIRATASSTGTPLPPSAQRAQQVNYAPGFGKQTG